MVGDEKESLIVSTTEVKACKRPDSLFIDAEDGIYVRHSATHWLRDPPFLQSLGLIAVAVGLRTGFVLGK